jgi:hypothetical protein
MARTYQKYADEILLSFLEGRTMVPLVLLYAASYCIIMPNSQLINKVVMPGCYIYFFHSSNTPARQQLIADYHP